MNLFDLISPSPVLHALGWTFVHALWQGSLLAAALALFNWMMRHREAEGRYWFAYALLLAQLVMGAATFYFLYREASSVTAGPINLSPLDASWMSTPIQESVTADTPSILGLMVDRINAWLPQIVLFWLVGMAFSFARLALGLYNLDRLRHTARDVEDPIWYVRLRAVSARLGLRTSVRLAESDRIHSPILIGQLKPMILFPIGFFNQLNPAQVEAVLAHELAHLHRFDYWLNLLQSVVEAIYCYHPAIWWISAQVRESREHCCDDWAVQACGDSLLYARTLMEVAEGPAPIGALGLKGARQGQLYQRIQRLLLNPQYHFTMREKCFVLIVLLGGFLLASANRSVSEAELRVTESEVPVGELLSGFTMQLDTLPKGKVRMFVNDDEGSIEVELDKGNIQHLVVDGRAIPASEYDQYQERVEELLNSAPPPPPAPSVPSVPAVPSTLPAPPTPPAPPAPPTPPTGWSERSVGNGTHYSYHFSSDTIIPSDSIQLFALEMVESMVPMIEQSVEGMLPMAQELAEMAIDMQAEMADLQELGRMKKEMLRSFEEERRKMEQEIRKLRQPMSEELEAKRKEVLREMEGLQERLLPQIKEMERELVDHLEQIERQRAEIIREAKLRAREAERDANREAGWIKWLVREGYIEDPNNYKIQFSNELLRINGKRQPDEVHAQTLKRYFQGMGNTEVEFNVTITRSKD